MMRTISQFLPKINRVIFLCTDYLYDLVLQGHFFESIDPEVFILLHDKNNLVTDDAQPGYKNIKRKYSVTIRLFRLKCKNSKIAFRFLQKMNYSNSRAISPQIANIETLKIKQKVSKLVILLIFISLNLINLFV